MVHLLWVLVLGSALQQVSAWDLKAPAEKYWHMKRLGLGVDEGHGVPFEVPSYHHQKYYHYSHHQQPHSSGQQTAGTHHSSSNRIPYFEKSDRSIASSRSASGCVYMGRRYSHGEEVMTSQACLNCTCQHGFVSCFRRVCPVLDPPENDDTCYLLKEPGTCCAVLKCSGLAASSPPSKPSATTTSSQTTVRPLTSTSAYHFNPGKNSFYGGNSIERKAVDTFRRQTSRPPYKDFWTSSRPTSRQQPQSRPFLRATSRPVPYASAARITTTLRPLNRHGFPSAPTFAQRRPNYPLSVNSKPTMRRTMYKSTTGRTTAASAQKTPSTMTSSESSHQVNPGLQSPLLDDDVSSEDSSNFFRMSSILV